MFRSRQKRSRRRVTERQHERGAALLVTMLLLALMAVVGMASLDTVMRDHQSAGHLGLSQTAFYAADAALSESLDLLRLEVLSPVTVPGDCLSLPVPSATLSNGSSYGPDPTAVTDEICMASIAEDCNELVASSEIGGAVFRYTLWNVRAEGVGRGGATSRVQATARRCHAFGN